MDTSRVHGTPTRPPTDQAAQHTLVRTKAGLFDLLPGGLVAFERILRRIDGARRSIVLRCFDWRDDDTGEAVSPALLRGLKLAAPRPIVVDAVASGLVGLGLYWFVNRSF